MKHYDLEFHLDWLGFTYKIESGSSGAPIDQFKVVFPEFSEFWIDSEVTILSGYAKFGYDHAVRFTNGICVSWSESDPVRMGVNVQVSGSSLSAFLDLFGFSDYSTGSVCDIFTTLINRNCSFSRVDLAYDDFRKGYMPYDYAKLFFEKRLATHIRCTELSGSDQNGWTFYFGSLKKRDKLLRIYDKNKESNGELDCVRYEFEYHHEKADKVVEFLLFSGGRLDFVNLITQWFKVLCKSKDCRSNGKANNIDIDENWLGYLQSLYLKPQFNEESIKIKVRKSSTAPKLVNSFDWFERCVLKTLWSYSQVYGSQGVHDFIRTFKPDKFDYRDIELYKEFVN